MITREDAKLVLRQDGGEKKLREALQARGTKIALERTDPYNHGYEPFHWKDAEELIEKNDAVLISGATVPVRQSFVQSFASRNCWKNQTPE